MITTKDIIENKADIISQVSEFDIYRFYIGEEFCLGCNIKSPLRSENRPSFNIRAGVSGLQWIDFGTGEKGDIIDFVKQKFNLGYVQAIKKIELDIPKIKGVAIPYYVFPGVQPKREIRVSKRPWLQEDLKWWYQFGITKETLIAYEVSPISHYWLKECNKELEFAVKAPTYSYHYGDYKYRLYCPSVKGQGYKWINNAENTVIQGWNQLSEGGSTLVLTSSLKDIMTLRSFGYEAIAAQSESAIIPEASIQNLMGRFSKIIVFLNNDPAGISATNRYTSRYGFSATFLPIESGCKDPAEYRAKFGEEESKRMFKELLG